MDRSEILTLKGGDVMEIGTKIKIRLVEINRNQRWLSETTRIPYRKLCASLRGERSFSYEELSVILWALEKSASDFISPSPPKQAS